MKNYCSLPPQEAGVCVFSCAVAGSVASFPLEDCYELWPDPVTAEVNGSFAIDFKETRSRSSASKSSLYSLFQILNKTVLGSNLDASKLAQFPVKFKDAQQCDVY